MFGITLLGTLHVT